MTCGPCGSGDGTQVSRQRTSPDRCVVCVGSAISGYRQFRGSNSGRTYGAFTAGERFVIFLADLDGMADVEFVARYND